MLSWWEELFCPMAEILFVFVGNSTQNFYEDFVLPPKNEAKVIPYSYYFSITDIVQACPGSKKVVPSNFEA